MTDENIALPDMIGAMRIHRRSVLACRAVNIGVGLPSLTGVGGRRSMIHDSRFERVRVYVDTDEVWSRMGARMWEWEREEMVCDVERVLDVEATGCSSSDLRPSSKTDGIGKAEDEDDVGAGGRAEKVNFDFGFSFARSAANFVSSSLTCYFPANHQPCGRAEYVGKARQCTMP